MKNFKDTEYGDLTGETFEGDITTQSFIKSLEGSPEIVNGDFKCSFSTSLKDLKGAPKIVNGHFSCSFCNSLKDLKGSPEIVEGKFYCTYCENLETLDGITESYKRIDCRHCPNLKNLDPLLKCNIEEIRADEHLLDDYYKKKAIIEKHGFDKAMEIIEVMDNLI